MTNVVSTVQLPEHISLNKEDKKIKRKIHSTCHTVQFPLYKCNAMLCSEIVGVKRGSYQSEKQKD